MGYDDAQSILSICRENHITLEKLKFNLALERVQLKGYIVERGGQFTDLSAIGEFAIVENPIPTNVTQL